MRYRYCRHIRLFATAACVAILWHGNIHILMLICDELSIASQEAFVSTSKFMNTSDSQNIFYSTSNKTLAEVFGCQPPGYPWYAKDLIQQKHNFNLFWQMVCRPKEYLHPPSGAKPNYPLYLVYEGNLYVWKKHLVIRNKNQFRSEAVEKLILDSLNLVKSRAMSEKLNSGVDPRLQGLITQPLPFFLDVGDFRKCWGVNYPLFTYATFSSALTTNNSNVVVDGELQSCIPLGIPYYQAPPLRPAIKINTSDVETWDSVFERQHKEYPWNNKVNEAVWRGSTTGAGYVYPNWRDLPRAKLVLASKVNTNSSKINAGFYKVVQRNSTEEQEIKDLGLLKESIPLKDFQKYKAVIDMDGNSWSSRFSFLLCMNSVVLKVQPDWSEYFFDHELSPYVHYLPIHKNLSNLEETISVVVNSENAALMKSIVHNANSWCKRKFTGTQRYLDMAWIIISYLELLKSEDFYSKNFTKWKNNLNASEILKKWRRLQPF